jgi:hypothetical protein
MEVRWDVYVFCLCSGILTRARGIGVASSSVRYTSRAADSLRFEMLKLSCTVSVVHVDFVGRVHVLR